MAKAVDRFELVGTTLVDKFRVERVVAEGGFGVVYAGVHTSLNVPIALKVLKVPEHLGANAKQEFFQSFVNEAQTIARIRHPNIVQVLDTGVSTVHGEAAPWMALEWLEGQTLADLLHQNRGRARTPAECMTVLRPVFEALAYAHDEGIAHRDLKPGNLMLVPTRRGTVTKLLDFGIAKLMMEGEEAGDGNTRTHSTMQAFSPYYAAPEQISRTRSGPWTDVHALGLILTEMLIGRSAYTSRDPTDLFREILADPRPTPAKFGVFIQGWDDVLQKAVAYRPDARFQNAGEFLAALDTARPRDEDVHGPPAGGTGAYAPIASNTGPGPQTGPMGVSSLDSGLLHTSQASVVVGTAPPAKRSSRVLAVVGALVTLGVGFGATMLFQRTRPPQVAAARPTAAPAPVAVQALPVPPVAVTPPPVEAPAPPVAPPALVAAAPPPVVVPPVAEAPTAPVVAPPAEAPAAPVAPPPAADLVVTETGAGAPTPGSHHSRRDATGRPASDGHHAPASGPAPTNTTPRSGAGNDMW